VDGVRGALVAAGEALTALLRSPEVAAAWSSPSALEGMTVGGVAGHLVRALETVETYLDEPEPPADDELLSAPAYYVRALDSAPPELHEGIRARGEAAGAVGAAALADEHEARQVRLAVRLPTERADRRVRVLRGQASMTLEEYLPTRLVEIVVHADDLAVSVGEPTPVFPTAVMDAVVGTLVATARRRHGDGAVVRALTRRERDDVGALRVL
jgi:hypothetical protein